MLEEDRIPAGLNKELMAENVSLLQARYIPGLGNEMGLIPGYTAPGSLAAGEVDEIERVAQIKKEVQESMVEE